MATNPGSRLSRLHSAFYPPLDSMTVLLVPDRKDRLHLYFEDPVLPDSLPADPHVRKTLRQRVLSGYHGIEKKFSLHERFLTRLHHTEKLQVVHSSDISRDEAERFLLSFVQRYAKKHYKWMIVDGVLAAVGAALFWVPGPNIFFFYPAIRTTGHHLARSGGRKYLSRMSCVWIADDRLSAARDSKRRLQAIEDLQEDLGWQSLTKFVAEQDEAS